ncbi:MAG: TetR/AcrR family transcriptional regulator [Acidimicrobiales bacterium]|nr:TetR/AcrR family transcriptional regulator [Acidimicrobiales bacterium]
MAETSTVTNTSTGAVDEMRTRIVDAGYRMLLQFGENKTSMGDIAEAADVSRGTLYRYFGDRDQLMEAVMDHTVTSYWDAIDARISDDMTLGDKIESRVRTAAVFSRGLVDQLQSGSVGMYQRMMTDDLARTSAISVERTIPMLEVARDCGELRPDLDVALAADWISRVMLSLIWLPVSTVVDLSDEKAAAKYAREMIMQGVGAPGTI